MNRYRCETCDHRTGHDRIPCGILLEEFPTSFQIGIPLHINRLGCASHSSHPSERDTVLDELQKLLTNEWEEAKRRADDPEWDETRSFSLPFLKKIISELRSKGEQG